VAGERVLHDADDLSRQFLDPVAVETVRTVASIPGRTSARGRIGPEAHRADRGLEEDRREARSRAGRRPIGRDHSRSAFSPS